jgi:hypothetical protein
MASATAGALNQNWRALPQDPYKKVASATAEPLKKWRVLPNPLKRDPKKIGERHCRRDPTKKWPVLLVLLQGPLMENSVQALIEPKKKQKN